MAVEQSLLPWVTQDHGKTMVQPQGSSSARCCTGRVMPEHFSLPEE